MSQQSTLAERIHKAILLSFNREDMRRILAFHLGENFDSLVADKGFSDQVVELLRQLDVRGRVIELLRCLASERQSTLDLAELCSQAERISANGRVFDFLRIAAAQTRHVPLQKPQRVQHFVGRQQELARLLDDLKPGRMITLCGPGGMGKSALAAEAVWRMAPGHTAPEEFPHGIVFHTFYHQPQADLALEAIARAYGVDPGASPRDAARLALAGKHALIVLDGAEAADNLEDVLAVAGECGVLITSRRHSDAPDEYQDIEPLPSSESLDLLRIWAGEYALSDAALSIVQSVGGLPLALFLIGRYLSQKRQRASEFAAWLHETGLDALHFADRPSKSIPLLMARSLEQVSPSAQEALGAVGLLALAPLEVEVIASALDISIAAAHRSLGELVDYGLMLRPDEQYQVTHALAHGYARVLGIRNRQALVRMAEFFAAICREHTKLGPSGFAQLDRQRTHMVVLQSNCFAAAEWDLACALALAAEEYLDLHGVWADRITILESALGAAKAAGDLRRQCHFLMELGRAHAAVGLSQLALQYTNGI